MFTRRSVNFIIIILLGLMFCVLVYAGETALEIIKKVDEKQKSKSSSSKMSMIIYPDAESKKNKRLFRIISYSKGEEENYMEFIYPKTIKGLRILSKNDDIWAYFASTGRVRKIAGKSKSKSVGGVGGDFSYEDIGGGKIEEKYNVKIVESDSKKWVIEAIPKKDDISYSKVLFSISKDKYIPLKIKYFKKGKKEKTLHLKKIKNINGRDTPMEMVMFNHRKDSKTLIIIHKIKYDVDIPDKYFNPTRFYK